MTQSGLQTIGFPESYLVRVFSTLNNPNALGEIMMSGLLLLAADLRPSSLIAGIAGFLVLRAKDCHGVAGDNPVLVSLPAVASM
jgi:hypothetical protein